MKKEFKISNVEIKELLGAPDLDLPKYSTQIINLANQNAQATRPRIVGRFQEAILKRVANILGKPYRLANPDEEA